MRIVKRDMIKHWPVSLGVVAVLLVGCGQDDVTQSDETTQPEPTTSTTSAPADPTTTVEDDMTSDDSATNAAIFDLASQANVSEDDIVIVETREVQWPDGSLGCPEEGKLYTQAVVEGTQVLLQVDGRIYDYRADDAGNVVLCPSEDKDGGYDFVPPPGFND